MCHRVGGTEQKTEEVSEAKGRAKRKKKKPSLSTSKRVLRTGPTRLCLAGLLTEPWAKADIQTRLIGSESNDHMSAIQHDLNKHV